MPPSFDVIIVGAGPAGCACAYQLAHSGLSVAILDKSAFPRDKICGDAISQDVLNQFIRMNPELGQKLLHFPPKQGVKGVRFVGADHQHLDIHKEVDVMDSQAAYVITRSEFDHLFFEEIQGLANLQVIQKQRVLRVENRPDGVAVETTDQTLRACMVIGADGANSIVNQHLGKTTPNDKHLAIGVRQYFEGVRFDTAADMLELHYYRELRPGYFWIFPLPNNRCNVGLGMIASDVKKRHINLKRMMGDFIDSYPTVKDRFKEARALDKIRPFPIPIGSRKVSCSGERFLLLGDAASLVDPLTGEGIGNAIRSGRIAAEHVQEAFRQNRFDAAFHRKYDQEIYRKMWRELQISRTIQTTLRYPRISNYLMAKARKNESLRKLLSANWEDAAYRQKLMRPRFLLKVLFS